MLETRANILLVDDRAANLVVLNALLEPLGHPIYEAKSGTDALKLLLQHDFAVILLDVQLPDIDGFEAAALIKNREKTRHIPIIFITAINTDPRHIFQGYGAGAVDYISKPFNPEILKSKVAVFVDLYVKTEQIKAQAELIRLNELREQELTLEKRHLIEISESQAKLRQFKATLDATLDCVMIFDEVSHRLVYANRGALQQLAYSEADLFQLTPMEICSGLPDCDFEETLNEIQNGERHALTFETNHIRIDGTEIPVEVLVQYIRPGEGLRGRFTWIARNIAERKRAEAEIAAAYERERRIAEVLQRSFLMSPPESAFPGISLFTVYEAAWDEANLGGDFFDAFLIGPETVAMVVGDVTGKGLQAAARTAEVKYSLRAYLRDGADPSKAMQALNRTLVNQWDDPDVHAFICLSLVIWDAASRTLVCSSAGCDAPVVIRTDGHYEPVEARGLPLGIDIESEYGVAKMELAAGDTIVMVTDGIMEARGSDGMFGDSAFSHCIVTAASGGTHGVRQVARSILAEAKRFAGGQLQDDACLLVARVVNHEAYPSPSLPSREGAKETNDVHVSSIAVDAGRHTAVGSGALAIVPGGNLPDSATTVVPRSKVATGTLTAKPRIHRKQATQ